MFNCRSRKHRGRGASSKSSHTFYFSAAKGGSPRYTFRKKKADTSNCIESEGENLLRKGKSVEISSELEIPLPVGRKCKEIRISPFSTEGQATF